MARLRRNTKIDTRSARLKLALRREPYWMKIGQGCFLGYRKAAGGGSWIARHYDPTRSRTRRHAAIGPADDHLDADGINALSFQQAQARCQDWFRTASAESGHEIAQAGPYTVSHALADYLTHYRREGRGLSTVRSAISVHIEPALGRIRVDRLTTARIQAWLDELSGQPGYLRTSRFAAERRRKQPNGGPDAQRVRRASANRILTVLKAALNHAWRQGRAGNDAAWRRVTPYRRVDAPRIRHLSLIEAQRLVHACSPDFRPLVQAALLTGARYGELRAARVEDFLVDAGILVIRAGKTGQARHIYLSAEGRDFLEDVAGSRPAGQFLFRRRDGKAWSATEQTRPMRAACAAAGIEPAVGFHILRHTYGSNLATRGLPMAVIANQLGHTTTRMTEKHYAHLTPSYIAEAVRQAFPQLNILDATAPVSLSGQHPPALPPSRGQVEHGTSPAQIET